MFKLFKRNGEYITRSELEFLIVDSFYFTDFVLQAAKEDGFEFIGDIKDLEAICKGKLIEDRKYV